MSETPANAPHVEAAKTGESLQDRGQPDSFPPEGTDEKVVQPRSDADKPLSDAEATKATKGVITQGLSGQGKASADWPNGKPPAGVGPADS